VSDENKVERRMLFVTEMDTPIGKLTAGASEEGVCFLEYENRKNVKKYNEFKEGENNHLVDLRRELGEYFKGTRKEFTVTLAPEGTVFQKGVWSELIKIPFGSTISYLDLADRLGNREAIRAAANANAKNPVAIVIPCHRVVGEKGKLTGYAGGLWRKKWLIDHEKRYSGQPVALELF
jgi:O-6-methylguanine DNA methyltransferase